MRLLSAATFLLTVFSPALGQGTPQPTPAAAASAPATTLPSALLQPALSSLRDAMGSLRSDKWKVPGAIRQKTDANVGSIQRDLDATLPGLLTTADGAPGSVSQVLPLSRNVDALYDVVLRVANTAELAAPASQSAALTVALNNLESARRSLGERLQTLAVAQDKQVLELKKTVSASAQPAAPAPCTPPVAAKTGAGSTHAKAKKPAAKPKTAGTAATPATPKQ